MSKEKIVEKECLSVLEKYGLIHWRNNVLSGKFKGFKDRSYRIIKTGTPGLADMSVLLNDGTGRTLYLELKRKSGGVQSQDQIDFESNCERLDVPYILVSSGSDLEEYLQILGLKEKL